MFQRGLKILDLFRRLNFDDLVLNLPTLVSIIDVDNLTFLPELKPGFGGELLVQLIATPALEIVFAKLIKSSCSMNIREAQVSFTAEAFYNLRQDFFGLCLRFLQIIPLAQVAQ